MKREKLFFLLLFIFFALLISGCAAKTRITSSPPNCSVSLNGNYIGSTPFDAYIKDVFGFLSVYEFVATKDGYTSDTIIITESITDDASRVIPSHIHFDLEKLSE